MVSTYVPPSGVLTAVILTHLVALVLASIADATISIPLPLPKSIATFSLVADSSPVFAGRLGRLAPFWIRTLDMVRLALSCLFSSTVLILYPMTRAVAPSPHHVSSKPVTSTSNFISVPLALERRWHVKTIPGVGFSAVPAALAAPVTVKLTSVVLVAASTLSVVSPKVHSYAPGRRTGLRGEVEPRSSGVLVWNMRSSLTICMLFTSDQKRKKGVGEAALTSTLKPLLCSRNIFDALSPDLPTEGGGCFPSTGLLFSAPGGGVLWTSFPS
mmetsp:Transcript_31814/g.62125  ORF Transcript_31814/g.62125 Transcript_31814/m.62125 type:complete len:271 (-) Transcript_31814:118-930(-)